MARKRNVTTFTDDGTVPYALDEIEVGLKAKELADVCGQIDKLEADARDHAGTERKKIRALKLRQRQLADCVRTGEDRRAAQTDLDLEADMAVDRKASKRDRNAADA